MVTNTLDVLCLEMWEWVTDLPYVAFQKSKYLISTADKASDTHRLLLAFLYSDAVLWLLSSVLLSVSSNGGKFEAVKAMLPKFRFYLDMMMCLFDVRFQTFRPFVMHSITWSVSLLGMPDPDGEGSISQTAHPTTLRHILRNLKLQHQH